MTLENAISRTGQYMPSKLPTLSLLRIMNSKNQAEEDPDDSEDKDLEEKKTTSTGTAPASNFLSLTTPRSMRMRSDYADNHLDEEEDAPDFEDQELADNLSLGSWLRPGGYSDGVVGLHQEIEDFYTRAGPSPERHQARLGVIERFRRTVMAVWPGCEVRVFGSFTTGLYLPSSDLDLVMFGLWETIPFRCMERILQDIAAPHSIEVIESAAVPIVKYDDLATGIKVDISFNNVSGLQSAEVLKTFKLEFPVLPKLVTVLKQFLLVRGLSTVFTGGLSSYSLSLMVISFLQLHARTDTRLPSDQTNLGVLLLEFLELYGHKFNYDSLAISVREGGNYFAKSDLILPTNINKRWADVQNLSIEHCLEPWKDVAKGTYNIQIIRRTFAYGYQRLAQGLRRSAKTSKGWLHLIL